MQFDWSISSQIFSGNSFNISSLNAFYLDEVNEVIISGRLEQGELTFNDISVYSGNNFRLILSHSGEIISFSEIQYLPYAYAKNDDEYFITGRLDLDQGNILG